MGKIRINVIEANRSINSIIECDIADCILGGLSNEPETIEELQDAAAAYIKLDKKESLFENPVFLVILILLLTFITFLPSLKNGFIATWDDSPYLLDNPIIRQLNFASIKAMFVNQVNVSYVPLPLLSFAIEYHFFGFAPIPFHVTNLILHLGCTCLVFYFFRLLKLDNIYAALGALLFGGQAYV